MTNKICDNPSWAYRKEILRVKMAVDYKIRNTLLAFYTSPHDYITLLPDNSK